MKDQFAASPEYKQFIAELKARVLSARISAAPAVNRLSKEHGYRFATPLLS